MFLYPFDISLKLLRESTSYFGYNPRICFTSACSVVSLEASKEKVRGRIRDVATEQSNISQLMRASRKGGSDVSHSIFQISPQNELRFLAQCNFGGVSRWALGVLLEEYKDREADATILFYRSISRTPDTASLRGRMFEMQVLQYLDGLGSEEFKIRGLTSPVETTWTPGSTRRFDFLDGSEFTSKLTEAVQNGTRVHLVPSIPNFPAVDSILYNPDQGLTFIQITISEKHPILVSGLKRIQRWLNQNQNQNQNQRRLLKGFHPLKGRPWRFLFIVDSGEATFEPQKLKGDSRGSWAEKVQQYVLGLDLFRIDV
jgi:hypothetical protein